MSQIIILKIRIKNSPVFNPNNVVDLRDRITQEHLSAMLEMNIVPQVEIVQLLVY